jgi:hypothetical protein
VRNTPVRDWLENAIGATERPATCDRCGLYPCPRHAADAVLNAARREDLIIMERHEADQVIEEARAEARAEKRPVPVSRYWPEPTGFRGCEDATVVTLTGVLAYLQRHVSPQGHAYMTGVLRLESGDVAVEVPPRYYAKFGGDLAEDEARILTGKVDRRGPIPVLAVIECRRGADA